MVNKWQDYETGPDAPDVIHAVVENPEGTKNKYEYDKEKESVVLDRVLHSAVHYPGDYGFIPRAYYEDGDPMDILVLTTNPTFPGCVIEARPIGILYMDDDGEQDDNIIAVPVEDPRWEGVEDIEDLHDHDMREIEEFFSTYKNLEPKKTVEIEGWGDSEEAKEAIEKSQRLYSEKFE
ncbi:MAG: inorganic diphosphatase [Candidatus Nanohaloarchaea archaeon]